ncbi:hypothetical protein EES43_27735 [Streptomyces sp. ADI96-02]|uniref:STAS domain-containing protein n=1 Tax=unclassified Streptomyces TaxID=2593676 RepID=UPI000F54E39E|nr:STAS domain-containing protein [Streptomyces sp. ADI96-02]RPK54861.1 hypothetical protein EES43_27735 [Streptomyces sp. ADI96-02]
MSHHEPRRDDASPLPVLAPAGDLDHDSLDPWRTAIDDAVTTHGGLVLDAGGITFADSAFLQVVIATHHAADLRIAALPPGVRRLFAVVGVDTFLNLYATVDDALAAPPSA